jgi:hypothetical protein
MTVLLVITIHIGIVLVIGSIFIHIIVRINKVAPIVAMSLVVNSFINAADHIVKHTQKVFR